jgi:hypothetical protein
MQCNAVLSEMRGRSYNLMTRRDCREESKYNANAMKQDIWEVMRDDG